MVRPSYRANLQGDQGGPSSASASIPDSIPRTPRSRRSPIRLTWRGARAPRRFVGWQTFFDFGAGEVKPNKRIDTPISTPLFRLPLLPIAAHAPPIALPQRNLLRHLTWSLPSAQAIAKRLGLPTLTPDRFAELAP